MSFIQKALDPVTIKRLHVTETKRLRNEQPGLH